VNRISGALYTNWLERITRPQSTEIRISYPY